MVSGKMWLLSLWSGNFQCLLFLSSGLSLGKCIQKSQWKSLWLQYMQTSSGWSQLLAFIWWHKYQINWGWKGTLDIILSTLQIIQVYLQQSAWDHYQVFEYFCRVEAPKPLWASCDRAWSPSQWKLFPASLEGTRQVSLCTHCPCFHH